MTQKHELIGVLVLCVSAVISGAEGWKDIVDFAIAGEKEFNHW